MIIQLPIPTIGSRDDGMTNTTMRITSQHLPLPDLSPIFTHADTNHMILSWNGVVPKDDDDILLGSNTTMTTRTITKRTKKNGNNDNEKQ
jgi:hypothetical protein